MKSFEIVRHHNVTEFDHKYDVGANCAVNLFSIYEIIIVNLASIAISETPTGQCHAAL
jgi:hypothetical protein